MRMVMILKTSSETGAIVYSYGCLRLMTESPALGECFWGSLNQFCLRLDEAGPGSAANRFSARLEVQSTRLNFTMVRAEKDPAVYLRKVEYFLLHDKYSPDTTASERSGIRKSRRKFELREGKMYYAATTRGSARLSGPVRRLVLFTKAEQDKALEEAHEWNGAHQGQKRTLTRLNQDYYWTTMAQDVITWISSCHSCQTMEKIKTAAPELHPIQLSQRWEILCVDLIGPLPVTENGHMYVCTVTDLFTKWVFARPTVSGSADAVASVLLEMIYSYGPPHQIISDQGQEFVNQVNSLLFDTFGVQHMVTSSYHPQTSGQRERSSQTLKRALSKYANDDQDDWDKYILCVTYGINTSVHTSTKQTPFFLMFHRGAPGATALNARHQPEDDQAYAAAGAGASPEEIQKELEETVAKVRATDDQVREHIEAAKTKRKAHCDGKRQKGAKRFRLPADAEVLGADGEEVTGAERLGLYT